MDNQHQKRREILTARLIAGGPLPKFDGITGPAGPPQAQIQAQAQPLQAQNSGPIRVPPLTPDKVAQYSSLFEESGAQNGVLSGMVISYPAAQAPIAESKTQAKPQNKSSNEPNCLSMCSVAYGTLQIGIKKGIWG